MILSITWTNQVFKNLLIIVMGSLEQNHFQPLLTFCTAAWDTAFGGAVFGIIYLFIYLLHIMRRIHETWLFLTSSQWIKKKTDIGDRSFSIKPHILIKSK